MRRFATASLLGLLLWACDSAGPTGFADFEANLSETPTGPSVTTDKPDYQPGDTVTITGSGFAAGETVRLHISESPPNHPDWSFDVVADGAGGFLHRQLVMDELHLGVLFTLTATGQTSGLVAGTTFTDGNPGTPIVTGQSPNPVAPGGSSTYDVSIVFQGNSSACTVTLTAVTAGSGWGGTFSFSPTSVTGVNGETKTSTLTVNAPIGLAGGTYQFTVTGTSGPECQGPNTRTSALTNFVVQSNSPPAAPAALGQFRGDGTTVIAVGGGTNQTVVVLKGVVSDPDAGNTVKLQVEVRAVGTPFTGVFTHESALHVSGFTAPVTVGSLAPGSFHWQARTVDNSGAASAWTSFGGNAEAATDFYIDTTPPAVTINQAVGQADPTGVASIVFTVEFSEPVTGFTTGDVTLGGTAPGLLVGTVTGGPTSYTVTVTGMTGSGTVVATVGGGVAQDLVGNANVASTWMDNSVTYDATPPSVTINQAVGQPDPTGLAPILFTVVFSEPVTGFATGDVTLGGTAPGTLVGAVSPSGPTSYTVTVTGMTGTGTVVASVAAGVAQDLVGNANLASTSTDNSVTYDQTPPVVSALSVTPNPTNGTVNVTFTATATDGLTTIASAQYRIDGGGFLPMVAHDGVFDQSVEVVTVQIPMAAIAALTDGSHTLCVRASDAFGNQSDADDSCTSLLVDKTPPALLSVAATPSPTNGTAPVVLNATASDALTNVTSAEYNIDGGTFATMSANDGVFDDREENVTVTIPAGVILALTEGNHTLCVRATDSVGNVSGDATACTSLFVDKTPPAVTGVIASPNPANGTVIVTLTATATDLLTNIASAEYRIDGGTFIGMSAANPPFDALTEGVTVPISAATIAGLADGDHTLCVRATDAAGNRSGDAAACTTLVVDRTPPAVSAVTALPSLTNGTVNVILTASATDALTNVTSAAYTIDGIGGGSMSASDGTFNGLTEGLTATILAATINSLSEGNHQLCVTATDAVSNTTNPAVCTTLVVDKSPPVVSAVAATPNPVAAGSNTLLTATISDATTGGANVTGAQYRATNPGYDSTWLPFNAFTPGVTVNVTKSLNLPVGVYDICVRGTDAAGNTTAPDDEMCVFLAVYDPSAGFVTGGGWINSPLGASTLFPDAVGKATFGFVSKYRRGANVPEGQTQFQFRAADLNFHSEAYQWLVVAGARAQYKGTGAINGVSGYGFMLTAIDGQVNGGGGTDKFRIKIWHVGSGDVIYDNQMGMDDSGNPTTVLGGGSIVLHAR